MPLDSTQRPFKDICPLLGLPGDPSVSFSYPSPENSCFAVDPSCPVRLEHQSTTCLSGSFKKCALYRFYNRQAKESTHLTLPPETLKQALNLSSGPSINRIWVTLALAAVLALLGFRFDFFQDLNLPSGTGAGQSDTVLLETGPTALQVQADSSLLPTKVPFMPVLDATDLPAQPSPTPLPPSATATQPAEAPAEEDTAVEAAAATPEPAPSDTSTGCSPQPGWVPYTVRSGDTLFKLSRAVGVSVDAIRQANCLVFGSTLYVGQSLYLPYLPPPPSTPISAATPTSEATPISEATATPTEVPQPTGTPTQQPSLTDTPTNPPPATETPPRPTSTPTQLPSSTPLPTDAPTSAPTPTEAPTPTQAPPLATDRPHPNPSP